ncbi:MerR family DNA-binding transcriptional regulator [Aeromicrobium sp. UC242_57]|uniref:MerR family DNA-binding transcriptional regulator n=1 Tax=Aeromicrobium sp. UC242_57 TaxID=3374624 RepID=UPI003793536F
MAGSDALVSIGAVARALGVSLSQVRLLTDAGVLPEATRTGGGHRRYELGAVQEAWRKRDAVTHVDPTGLPQRLVPIDPVIDRTVDLQGLDESLVWRDAVDFLDLDGAPRAKAIAQYAFTEMLNNAIDHSKGVTARIRAWRHGDRIQLEVVDDGVGVYRNLREGKDLPDLYSAIAELTKGKQTTAPAAHSGEGIFFTSKAVDVFTLEANGISWIVDNQRSDHAVGISHVVRGTSVRLTIDLATGRSLGDLFREFSDDHEFTRTRPVIKLFAIGVDFVSRSEAKRLLVDMDKFSDIELDFSGVDSVGQGFVDDSFGSGRRTIRERP